MEWPLISILKVKYLFECSKNKSSFFSTFISSILLRYREHMIWSVNERKHNFFLAFYWHFIVAFHLSLCVSIFFFTLSVVVLQTIISSSVFSCLLKFSLLFISQHWSFFFSRIFYLYVFLWNSFILLFLASKVTVFLIYRILCASRFFKLVVV